MPAAGFVRGQCAVCAVAIAIVGVKLTAHGNATGSLHGFQVQAIDAELDPSHIVAAIIAITMTGAVLVARDSRPRGRVLRPGGWVGLLSVAPCAPNTWLMHELGTAPHG
jgi:hypothetical protein